MQDFMFGQKTEEASRAKGQLLPSMELSMMNKLQPYLDDWEMLTLEEKAYVANGCGPKFGIFGGVVPDFGSTYTPACNIHDWIYWSGGPVDVRLDADVKFRKDLEEINLKMSWWRRWLLSWVPRVYYLIVRRFGDLSWHKSSSRRTREDLQREMRDANI